MSELMPESEIQQATRLLLERLQSKRDIHTYMTTMKTSDLRAFEFPPAKHHNIIIDDLHELSHGDMRKYAASLPPGSAKSTYGSVIFPTFLLAMNPKLQILCVSNTEKLAEGFARQRRAIMRTDEWQAISGNRLASDAQSLGFCGTDSGGGIYSAGAGSSVTGLRCDYLICDDLIVGIEQANSITQLDKIWDWYLSEARSRLKPNGRELMLATRWSSLDPIGRVIQLAAVGLENWKYLRIPMEADSINDPLEREMGERLWKEWYTEEMVSDAKRDSVIWQTLYQQSPAIDSGAWVPPEKIQIERQNEVPSGMKYYIGVDIALSVGRGDYTSFTVMGLDVNKSLHIVYVYREQVSPEMSAYEICKLSNHYNPVQVMIDNDNASKVWSRLVYEESKKIGKYIPLRIIATGNKDKETRAAPLRAYFLQDRVFILEAEWNKELLSEISEFPAGRHDDQIDALALVARDLIKLSPPKKPHAPRSLVNNQSDGYYSGTLTDLFESNEHKSAGKYRKMRI
jgi:predicted phage terminase large subunit-like protein